MPEHVDVLSSEHEGQEKAEADEDNDLALFLWIVAQVSPVEYHE